MADGEEAATAYTIGWEPQPGPQTALLACPVFEVFFGGARGGGKTDGMLGEWASHADLHGKNAVGLMVRRERVQLLETIERSRQIYGPIGARYNDQDKMWRWPNGARLRFAYLERDADADAYQGHSYTRVYVEELGTFPSASPVLRLMATLRSGEGVPCGFRATGNPGGPGHQWVKARYIDPNPAGWEVRKFTYENPWTRDTIEQDRVFIPSKLQDNKFLGPEYVANLQMVGSDTLVRAWLEGDWTVIEGAYFDCWRYDLHVVEPFEVPAHWARFRSMDWGSAKPFSVGWWAIVGDDHCLSIQGASRIIPRGALLRYREWYGAAGPNVGLKMTAEAVADGIVERERSDAALRYGVLDPACFKEDGGPSIAERINKVLIQARLRPFHAADNSRVPKRGSMGGWDQLRSRLVGQDGRPMIYCFSTHADEHSDDPGPPTRSGAARGRQHRVRGSRGGRVALRLHVPAVRAGARDTHEERARRGIRRIPLCRARGLEALLMPSVLDGSSLISLEPHEGALPGAPDTVATQIIPVHFAQSTAYRNTLQPWRGQRSLSELGIHPHRRIQLHLCTTTEHQCRSTIA